MIESEGYRRNVTKNRFWSCVYYCGVCICWRQSWRSHVWPYAFCQRWSRFKLFYFSFGQGTNLDVA